jgi:carbamoyl-phosphate synthase small subunit
MEKLKLILEDGSVYSGVSFGSNKEAWGEVVFNTGMTGYPESLTDPSYCGQILVLTYPLVGNYGVPPEEELAGGVSRFFESKKVQVSGLLVSSYSQNPSHWEMASSLGDFLKKNQVPAISGIDTRSLTKKLREKGTMLGKIVPAGASVKEVISAGFRDPNKEPLAEQAANPEPRILGTGKKRILCLDFGMKDGITRYFLNQSVSLKIIPGNSEIKKEEAYDGLFLSNGPGDPEQNKKAIQTVKTALNNKKPILGICLGNQILALAAGGKTYKLKYGHRGQNQPCFLKGEERCYLTSQNHGFAVEENSLPPDWRVWFCNANDGTVEGIEHQSGQYFSVQFHPEASPGPEDTSFVFERFLKKL